jgi:hypothetical protein
MHLLAMSKQQHKRRMYHLATTLLILLLPWALQQEGGE